MEVYLIELKEKEIWERKWKGGKGEVFKPILFYKWGVLVERKK